MTSRAWPRRLARSDAVALTLYGPAAAAPDLDGLRERLAA